MSTYSTMWESIHTKRFIVESKNLRQKIFIQYNGIVCYAFLGGAVVGVSLSVRYLFYLVPISVKAPTVKDNLCTVLCRNYLFP